MIDENSSFDRKSLRLVSGKTASWDELAKDCVAFANANGGRILIGIEDDSVTPPPNQVIPETLGDQIQKRVSELTVNVQVLTCRHTALNGGQFLEVTIPRASSVASTTDGRFYLRVSNTCAPIVGGEDLLRLINERSARPWEMMDSGIPLNTHSTEEASQLLRRLRASERVKASVKDKSDAEIILHYGLIFEANGNLTMLGALLIGGAAGRRAIGTASIVQAISYDENEIKINKWNWDDYHLSPVDLVDSIWKEIPAFRESYEIEEGLFRRNIPAYDESVIRELLVNALVHRPYTQKGDIFLNFHPDRLVVVNPGRLPIGVTPQNILRTSRRRNDGLARIFHDIGLMEREGSGFDLMYDRLLSQGRPVPIAQEGSDSVCVSIQRRILKPEALRFIEEANNRHNLTQRERITLGLLAQSEGMNVKELAVALEAESTTEVASWLGRLEQYGLVKHAGNTSATRYFIPPDLLRASQLDGHTTLTRIEPHRLQELIRTDISRYPNSAISEIHRRVGEEIPRSAVKRELYTLVASGQIQGVGKNKWRRYTLA